MEAQAKAPLRYLKDKAMVVLESVDDVVHSTLKKEKVDEKDEVPMSDDETKGSGMKGAVVASLEDAEQKHLPDSGREGTTLLYNFRDLAVASTDPTITLVNDLIFRSACLTRGNLDEEKVGRAIQYLTDNVNIRTIIDLRTHDEKKEDIYDWLVEQTFPTLSTKPYERTDEDTELTTTESIMLAPNSGAHSRRRYNISFVGNNLMFNGLLWQAPRSTKIKVLMSLFNRNEMAHIISKDVMNNLGLAGLNKMMLIYSSNHIATAMRIIADPANHPLMIHCASGKDRTGLLCALVLACCSVDERDIIANYAISESYLANVKDLILHENEAKGLDQGFLGTPEEVMQETLEFIKEKWDSVNEYLNDIGFTFREQTQLAQLLHPTIPDPPQQNS